MKLLYKLLRKNICFGLLSITFIFPFKLKSQNTDQQKDSIFYREDQIYFGVSLLLLRANQENLNTRGLSRHFQLGLMRDIPLIKSGKLSSGLGLGISFEKFTTNLIPLENEIYSFDFENNMDNYFSVSVNSFEIPFAIRWRNSTNLNYAFWRVYGGIKINWNFLNRVTEDLNFETNNYEINTFVTNTFISFGYNTWNFYLSYPLNPIFNSKIINSNNSSIRISPIKVGLIFFIL